MAQGGSRKIANSLVTASGAAVLAVYAAGYVRTQSSADRFAREVAERRVASIAPQRVASVRDGLQAKTTTIPSSVLPPPQHPANRASAAPPTPHPEGAVSPAPAVAATSAAIDNPTEPAPPAEVDKLKPVLPNQDPPIEEAPAPAAAPAAAPANLWKDGSYTGWGFSRHGNIEATVTIAGGRIASAVISQCRTRYSCSVIDILPPQVAQRQSPDVDYVSGATQSADAFYQAVAAALGKAK